MSFDAYTIVTEAAQILYLGILAVATLRGVQIGRGLVDRTFKTRAYWTSLTVFIFISTTILNGSTFFAAPQPTVLGAFLGSLPWQIEFFVLFAFLDSTIVVTIRMDFFHRNTLKWNNIRRPLMGAYLVSDVVGFTVTNYAFPGGPPEWAIAVFYVAISVVLAPLALGIPILLVGARRTPDRTMRKFVTLLGITIFVYVFVGSVLQSVSQATIVLSPIAAYLFYLTVMSLSPVGRVENGAPRPSLGQVGAPK